MIRNVDERPEHDLAEVIRCKYCQYRNPNNIEWCELHDIPTSANRFCDWAKEKGGADA